MKKILVPTDYSSCANRAFQIAQIIASKSQAEITLLNVLDYSSHITSVYDTGINEALLVDVFKKLSDDSTNKMNQLVHNSIMTKDIIKKIEIGIPRDVINNELGKGVYDLVIMGTTGTSGIKEVFIGSNTERIVRDSNVPVLSINEDIKEFNPQTIVYASDFEEKPKGGFDKVLEFANLFKSQIKLVRINTPNSFENTVRAERLMEKFAEGNRLNNYTFEQFDYEDFEAGLNRYVERVNGDVVVIGTHGRGGLKYFYYGGSKAEDVVNHFSVPVLTFKLH